MTQYIIGHPDFVKNLDDWLFKNDQKNAAWIASKVTQIPPPFKTYSGFLYRGMSVDKDFQDKISAPGGSITFSNFSSWSKSEKIARSFVDDPKYVVGDKGSKKIFILLKRKFTPAQIVLDIHGFVLFMGTSQLEMLGVDEMSLDSAMNEEEVLIKKGLKITKKDFAPW